jgi:hypothetical protein
VIIRNLNLVRVALSPDKANAPLIVNSDTVLSLAIATQRFEPVPGRRRKFTDLRSGIDLTQLAECHAFDVFEARHLFAQVKPFSVA